MFSRRLLPLLSLSLAAFAASWRLTPGRPPFSGDAPDGRAAVSLDAAQPEPARWGLARREFRLREMENPGTGDLPRLLDSEAADDGDRRHLAGLWAERDPAGLWKWLQTGGWGEMEEIRVIPHIFESWLGRDPPAALTAFLNADDAVRAAAAGTLISGLLGRDAALRGILAPHLDDLVAAEGSGVNIPDAFHPEPGQEQERLEILVKMPAGSSRDRLMESAAWMWMWRDWKTASRWADTLAEPVRSKVMITMAGMTHSASSGSECGTGYGPGSTGDPASCGWARRWFEKEATPGSRQKLARWYIANLAETDPAAALRWARENLRAAPLAEALSGLFTQLGEKDSATARTLVEELPRGRIWRNAAFAAAGAKPTMETVIWLLGQPVERTHPRWTRVAQSWSAADPAGFRRYLESADTESLPPALVSQGIDPLVYEDRAGTAAWAARAQTPETASRALQSWSLSDPVPAALWLKDHTTATEWNQAGLATVAGRYFSGSPPEAVDWAVSLPAGAVRDSVIAALRKTLSETPDLTSEARSEFGIRLSRL